MPPSVAGKSQMLSPDGMTTFPFKLVSNHTLPWAKEGNLGQCILKRYNVVMDYAHQTMILEPDRTFQDPFDFNMADILFIRTEDGLLIITPIVPGFSGSRSRAENGDILETGGRKTVT